MTTVRFLEAASDEFLEAPGSYAAISHSLGADFLNEIEAALDRVRVFPKHGSRYLHGSRRALIRGFPFQMVYLIDVDVAIVVAVAHQHREPGYWSQRVSRR